MNKTNAVILSLIFLTVISCSKFGSNIKNTKSAAPEIYTPTAEQTASPSNQNLTGTINKANSSSGENAEIEEKRNNNPTNHNDYFQMGKKYQADKSREKAVGAFKKAIELKPDFAEANYELGKIYLDRKEFETSLPYLQKAAKLKDTIPEYLIAVGDNYRELKICNSAIPPYGMSVNYNDKIPAAYYGMGLCYLQLNNRLSAETQLRSLVKLDKNLAAQLKTKIEQYR